MVATLLFPKQAIEYYPRAKAGQLRYSEFVLTLQRSLWCPCGRAEIHARGLCRACYEDWRRDESHFAGLRDRVLARDGACLICAEYDLRKLLVHHRRPGANRESLLATLCRAHHNQVHHLGRIWYGMNPKLRQLWLEVHRGQPLQLELALGVRLRFSRFRAAGSLGLAPRGQSPGAKAEALTLRRIHRNRVLRAGAVRLRFSAPFDHQQPAAVLAGRLARVA